MLEINPYAFLLKYDLNVKHNDAPLIRLPIEVIHQILCQLDIQNISVCSLVCRNLYLIRTQANLWEKLYVRDFPFHSPINNLELSYSNYRNSNLIRSNLINGRYSLSPFSSQLSNISTFIVREGKIFFGSDNGGVEIRSLRGDKSTFLSIGKPVHCLDACNTMLFSGHNDGTIGVLDLGTKKTHFLEGHTDQITALVFSKGRLFSGSSDHTIKIWDATNWNCLKTLQHTREITDIVILDDQIFSKSKIGPVIVWDANEELFSFQNRLRFIVFNRELFLVNDNTIEICNSKTGDILSELRGHSFLISSLFIIEGVLCSIDVSNNMIIWDLKTKKCLKKLSSFKYIDLPSIVGEKILLQTWKKSFEFLDFKASRTEVYKSITELLMDSYDDGMKLFCRMPQVEREKIYAIFAPLHGVDLAKGKSAFHDIECSREDREQMIQAIKVFLKSFTE